MQEVAVRKAYPVASILPCLSASSLAEEFKVAHSYHVACAHIVSFMISNDAVSTAFKKTCCTVPPLCMWHPVLFSTSKEVTSIWLFAGASEGQRAFSNHVANCDEGAI